MKNNMIILSLAVLAGLTSACGANMKFGLAGVGQNFKQSTSAFANKLDILWVIDNSSSMSPLQTNLTSNYGPAISSFKAKGWDFRMAVTTTDAYKADPTLTGYSSSNSGLSKFRDGSGSSHTGVFVILPTTPNYSQVFTTNATQGTGGSGDERAFSSFRMALKDPANAGFVRSDSFFAIIILSDEDDFSGNGRPEYSWQQSGGIPDHDYSASTLDPISTYTDFLDQTTSSSGVTRRYNVSAITVDTQACQSKYGSIIGQRYIDMANATKGIIGSVCDSNFSSNLTAIANQIAVLSTQFYLQTVPDPSTIHVVVNGVTVPQDANNGWTYDPVANSVQFHGGAIPPQGADINVTFAPNGVMH